MAENRGNGARKLLILLVVFVVAVLGAYGLGRWQGAQAAAGVEARAAEQQQSAAASVAQAEAELAALRSRVQMLEARRRLHLALMALDERNFGTAREHLLAAGNELAAVQRPPASADAPALSRLAQELQSARLVATEDFAAQRNRITGWVRALDAQLPTEAAAPASAGASTAEPGPGPEGAAPATGPVGSP